jgi:DNA-binding MarR family transcriptional regulator
MSNAELQELRSALVEVLAAERRLRSREPRRPGELSHAQVRALVQVAKGEEVTVGDLAKRADLSAGAMTVMVDHLEREGMITRRRSEADRRQVFVALTERGHEEIAGKRAAQERFWRKGFAGHSDEELQTATRVMRTIAKLLDETGQAS